MNESRKEIKPIFILDIPKYSIGDRIIIVGIVEKRKKFQNSQEGVWLRDITGKILIIIDTIGPLAYNLDPKSIWVGTRIRVSGQLAENSRKIRVLKKVSNIEVLVSPETKLSELDAEMREQASRMLMSRICYKASEIMRDYNFIEFESSVISNRWNDDGLEPLQVVFPGFGSPAVLIPSPSPQIVEFLTITLIPRAFTISTSFTQSYRFSNSAADTCVIVAKATDLDLDNQIQLLKKLSEKILKQFIEEVQSFSILNGVWPNAIDGMYRNEKQLTDDLNLVKFSANIPVIGENWDAHIAIILQLLDKDKNILAEGARELLANEVVISSLTIYPSQFLGLIEKAPRRQLQNLMRLYDGKRY